MITVILFYYFLLGCWYFYHLFQIGKLLTLNQRKGIFFKKSRDGYIYVYSFSARGASLIFLKWMVRTGTEWAVHFSWHFILQSKLPISWPGPSRQSSHQVYRSFFVSVGLGDGIWKVSQNLEQFSLFNFFSGQPFQNSPLWNWEVMGPNSITLNYTYISNDCM